MPAGGSLRILPGVIGQASDRLIGYGIEDVNHELYGGLYSQLVYGEDFEEPAGKSGVSGDLGDNRGDSKLSPTWAKLTSSQAQPSPAYETVTSGVFNGKQAQLMSAIGSNPARIINRGLYQQGLYIQKGREYEGYLYARIAQNGTAYSTPQLTVSLVSMANESSGGERTGSSTLPLEIASSAFQLSGTEWTRLNFRLTPSVGSACRVVAHAAGCRPNLEKECIVCDGGFVIAVVGGAVVVDFVFFQMGDWGRFRGLPVRDDVAKALIATGVRVLRLGGSMCNVEGYRWKNMRGPRERRQPYSGNWHPFASQGWRLFEFLDFCEALGVQAVVTLNSDEATEDLADLIEYAHGGADTSWGRLRIADGQHLAPYAPFVIEIGNEQPLSYQFIRAVADGAEAMRLRAGVVGLDSKVLRFAIGENLDMADINTVLCDTMVNATKFLGANLMWDLHTFGQLPSEEDHWKDTLTMALEMLDRLDSRMLLAVFEENANTHDLLRGLNRARQANTYDRLAGRFAMATAANGLQVLGFNDNGWDQGAIFMGPDRVWFSPYGYVDGLIAGASEPVVLQTTVEASSLDVVGARSEDGSTFVLRVVNSDAAEVVMLSVKLPEGASCDSARAAVLEVPAGLAPESVNPPSNVTRVSPREYSQVREHDLLRWRFQPMSLTAFRWTGCRHEGAFVMFL
eukprot:TRINITY_DN28853_c0_g1_i1.p1 TRINITY_DN28853_c0_g1~~TRINITY_DN28853_c0_g1_i1.p1  ORF type:complete len:737 (-),score=92.26 TRINITY_DN28853_c0_g1_i1:79-2124(-)